MEENETQYRVSPTLVQQFAGGWLADENLTALSVRSGDRLGHGASAIGRLMNPRIKRRTLAIARNTFFRT
jgi:hypothetical protein